MPSPNFLPVPDATGIYGFPATLQAAHCAWLDESARADDVMELIAPHNGDRYVTRARRPSGRPILVIEPHHDDLILSASGFLLQRPRPLTVVTVFTQSASVHPSLTDTYESIERVSALRAAEAAQSLRPLGAHHIELGYKDADPPYSAYGGRVLEEVTERLRTITAESPEAELLAPAAVTRHPDHLLVHEAARRLGCRWFWEDVAFWPTYALGADDQHLFKLRTKDALVPEFVDISSVVLDKLTLMRLHASQMQPLVSMYRPIRYAWTTAAALRDADPKALYAERFYRSMEPR